MTTHTQSKVTEEQSSSANTVISAKDTKTRSSRSWQHEQHSVDPSGRKRLRMFGENTAIFLLFILLTVLLTYPSVLHLADRVIGGRGDNYHYLWTLWHTSHALFDLHSSPLFSPDLFVPYGFSLIKNMDMSPATVLLFV